MALFALPPLTSTSSSEKSSSQFEKDAYNAYESIPIFKVRRSRATLTLQDFNTISQFTLLNMDKSSLTLLTSLTHAHPQHCRHRYPPSAENAGTAGSDMVGISALVTASIGYLIHHPYEMRHKEGTVAVAPPTPLQGKRVGFFLSLTSLFFLTFQKLQQSRTQSQDKKDDTTTWLPAMELKGVYTTLPFRQINTDH